MKSAVIEFPGSNCDRDAARALERLTGKPAAMVWHKDTSLPEGIDLVVLPGGFSYGDYLRSGAMAARCAMELRIPQPGGEESLNVAAAAAVCLYESSRQRC